MISIVFLGESGSGKDEATKVTVELFNATPFKFKHSFSKFLESYYGLQDQELDTPQGKSKTPDHANSTYLEILVDSLHFWEKHDPLFSVRYFLDWVSKEERSLVVFSDVRKVSECRSIISESSGVIPILIQREGSKKLSSDQHLDEILKTFGRVAPITTIQNNGSIVDLRYKVSTILGHKPVYFLGAQYRNNSESL